MGLPALSFNIATDHHARCTGKPCCGVRLKPAAIRDWQSLDLVYRQRIDSRYGIRKRVVRTDLRRRDHEPAGAAGAAG
jgi:hypothetical protein